MPEQDGNSRLDSWKTIAAYLGRDVRTVIRWEQARGLPIRRLPGTSRSAVFAYKHEIDTWLTGQRQPTLPGTSSTDAAQVEATKAIVPPPEPPAGIHQPTTPTKHRPWIRIAVGLAALPLLALSIYCYSRATTGQPAEATFTTDTLQTWDNHHRLLWEYRFPQPFATTAKVGDIDPSNQLPLAHYSVNRASIHDLYGDGRREILAITIFRRGSSPTDLDRQVLSCFSPSGKLLWTYEPQTTLTFGSKTHSAPWDLHDLMVSEEPGRKTIWVNVVGYVWGKSFIAKLDADGHPAIQFVNSGVIDTFQRFHTAKGAMLWIGGFNDEYDTASLAIMSDTQPYAVSPQTPGSHYFCVSCGTGDPAAYFVFPRYDMGRALHRPSNEIHSISSDAATVEVHQAELSVDDQVFYDFPRDAQPIPESVSYSATFWPHHLDLERQGKLDHPLAKCPDRLHPPPVRLYQNGVWRNIIVPAPSK
jgi:hypothetical protein